MITKELFEFDIALSSDLICGIDETGRGPLAGPVVAAACIMDYSVMIDGIKDSKKIPEAKRELLFEKIISCCKDYSVSVICADTIDKINILRATELAMQNALGGLKFNPNLILIDGNDKFDLGVDYKSIIKGDQKSYSIAAASIIAKVTRDRIMTKACKEYPEYNFSKHKGYGTLLHYEAVKKYGLCALHRKSFFKNYYGK